MLTLELDSRDGWQVVTFMVPEDMIENMTDFAIIDHTEKLLEHSDFEDFVNSAISKYIATRQKSPTFTEEVAMARLQGQYRTGEI